MFYYASGIFITDVLVFADFLQCYVECKHHKLTENKLFNNFHKLFTSS